MTELTMIRLHLCALAMPVFPLLIDSIVALSLRAFVPFSQLLSLLTGSLGGLDDYRQVLYVGTERGGALRLYLFI